MPSTRRCVFGYVTTGVSLHSFPQPNKNPDRFRLWVNLAGDSVKDISDDLIYILKRVSDIHFTDDVRNRNKRLNALAIPTLFLPAHNNKDPSDKYLPKNLLERKA